MKQQKTDRRSQCTWCDNLAIFCTSSPSAILEPPISTTWARKILMNLLPWGTEFPDRRIKELEAENQKLQQQLKEALAKAYDRLCTYLWEEPVWSPQFV